MWVRDSTAGIGTLTFYDPVTKGFGALGHGSPILIREPLCPFKEVSLSNQIFWTVKKGTKGNPGELKGVLIEDSGVLEQ